MNTQLLLFILGGVIFLLLTVILMLTKAIKILRRESLTDHLTKLPNRRFFDQVLKHEFSESQRYQNPLSLITIDLDYFKKYNDQYGHPAGDRLLKKFAGLLEHAIRESDYVCRIGGEEFSIICPQSNLAGTKLLAERIRLNAQEELGGTTISLGIASFPKDAKEEKDLIEKSDQALYKAKEKRNCVVVYGEN